MAEREPCPTPFARHGTDGTGLLVHLDIETVGLNGEGSTLLTTEVLSVEAATPSIDLEAGRDQTMRDNATCITVT